MSRLKELRTTKQNLLERNAHWKSCKDGSYESALYSSGYYSVVEEIRKLEKYHVEEDS